ncbi:MAG: NAD(P)H-dependent oxidoreductase [Chitinispirillaceae bacterium]
MKLAIFNGSPRNNKSNSKLLTDQFLSGYGKICSESVPVHFIADRKKRDEGLELFRNAEAVIIIFPLYTDCMPGIVKEFFENLSILELKEKKKVGFIVQSGFPEAIHSVYVEYYLKKLTGRLQCEYLGTVIKGGVEGIQIMPPFMTMKLYSQFQTLGEFFAENTAFSPEVKENLRQPYKMSSLRRIVFEAMSRTGLANFYWDSNLKKNDAFEKRFDTPFR